MLNLKRIIFYVTTLVLLLNTRVGAQNIERNVTVTLNVGDTILRVKGRTFPGAFVTIRDGGATIGTTTANGSGNFDKSFPAQDPGLHTLKIFAEDIATNIKTDTVTQTVSLQPKARTTVDFFLPTTLIFANDQVNQGFDVVIAGRTIPNGNITVRLDDKFNYTTQSDSDGNWSLIIGTADFVIGTHRVFAVANDNIGNQSSPTTERTFTVLPPGAQAPEKPDEDKKPDTKPGEEVEDDEDKPGGIFNPIWPVKADGGVNKIGLAFGFSTISLSLAALFYFRPTFLLHLIKLFRR